jgi:hypothetical protein
MSDIPQDIYTEPHDFDTYTLAKLGPLARMAGIWEGKRGLDGPGGRHGGGRRERI